MSDLPQSVSSPQFTVENDITIKQTQIGLLKLNDTSSDTSLPTTPPTVAPIHPNNSPPSPRNRGNAFIAAKRPSELIELGQRTKSSSLANARAKAAAWKSAAVRKIMPNSNPGSPAPDRKSKLQNGTPRLKIFIQGENDTDAYPIAPNGVVENNSDIPIGGSPPNSPRDLDLINPRTSHDDSVFRESRKTNEIVDISQTRLGISTELILQKRKLFNKNGTSVAPVGMHYSAPEGVPPPEPINTSNLVSSDSAIINLRSTPMAINGDRKSPTERPIQPWLNPLMTNTPTNTNNNNTSSLGISPSAPSLLTAGTVLAVASSSNNTNQNNSSPNNTLRKKKGSPIKTGWLRLNNTIRWFELLKYKMIYYASNNDDEDPMGFLMLEFRCVELTKVDNVATIEFLTDTLEKLYLTGFNDEETQVWFAAIKSVLSEWREHALKYGDILQVGQWLGRKLLIYAGSWNVGNASPPDDISAWVPKSGYDILAFGSQECAYQPRQGMTNAEDWFYRITATLGDEYVTVESLSLWQIRLIVLVRRELAPFVSQVCRDSVACGIANVMGNKGAVGISFTLYDYSFCFISSHLAAHIEKVGKRNADYKEIISQMKLGNKDIDINNQFHYMFWVGDLNYRLEAPRDKVLDLIKNTNIEQLLALDQLFLWKHRGEVFHGFEEHTIAFMPTYRFDRSVFDPQGRRIYSEEKMRVPSWTDRVLWRGLPNCPIEVMKYDAVHSVATSDHSPIFCTFCVTGRLTIPMWKSLHDKPMFFPSEGKEVFVKFTGLKAYKLKHVKEKGKKKDPNPYIKFVAPFLPNDQKWKTSIAKKTINPDWGDLKPIPITEKIYKEYLATQHIFLLIQSDEIQLHNAMLGQATLSLLHCINQPYNFSLPISYNGKHHGTVEGTVEISFPHFVAYGKTVVGVSTPIGVKKFVNILSNGSTPKS